jgi:hypothetical protein
MPLPFLKASCLASASNHAFCTKTPKQTEGGGVDVHDSFDERNLVAVVHAGTSFEIVSSGVYRFCVRVDKFKFRVDTFEPMEFRERAV